MYRVEGLGFRNLIYAIISSPKMENQMDKTMEHAMETREYTGFYIVGTYRGLRV